MPKTGRGLKAKGDAFERELAAHINALFSKTDEGHELCKRAPLSGGGVINQMSGGADLIGPPILHVEAKRVERLSFPDAMRQAEASLAKTKAPEIPVVINRRNRMRTGDSYTLVRLDHFLWLYSYFLQTEGHVRSFEAEIARKRITGQLPYPDPKNPDPKEDPADD